MSVNLDYQFNYVYNYLIAVYFYVRIDIFQFDQNKKITEILFRFEFHFLTTYFHQSLLKIYKYLS